MYSYRRFSGAHNLILLIHFLFVTVNSWWFQAKPEKCEEAITK